MAAKRTPLTKAKKGALKDAFFEDLLSAVLKGAIASCNLDPILIEDLQVGTVRTPRGGATISRMAALHAGLPESCSVSSVNRQCSSSLQAVWTIANQIRNGDIDIGIGAGVESMSKHYNNAVLDHEISTEIQTNACTSNSLSQLTWLSLIIQNVQLRRTAYSPWELPMKTSLNSAYFLPLEQQWNQLPDMSYRRHQVYYISRATRRICSSVAK